MRRLALSAVIAAAVSGAACSSGGGSSTAPCTTNCTTTPPKAIPVSFTGGTINAELATLRARRDTGLMNRTSIAADSGMLFVFAVDQAPNAEGFWMLNTHFDLSIAFLDSNRAVINLDDMTKETLTIHTASRPFRYAVEATKGWFAAHGVVAGAIATFTIPAGTIIDP